MSKLIIKLFSAASVLAIILTPAYASAVTGTGTASLSLSPTHSVYSTGSTFSVAVNETSSESIASVEADMTYDTSMLECLGVDGSSSAFAQSYQSNCSGGVISIARTVQGTPVAAGSAQVATISFKVLAGSGSTPLVVSDTSDIRNASVASVCDNTCAAGAVAGTYSFIAPAPVAPVTSHAVTPAAPSANSTLGDSTTPTPAPTTSKTTTPKKANITTQSTAKVQAKNSNAWVAYAIAGIVIVLGAAYYLASKYKPELLAKYLQTAKPAKK